MAFEMKRPAKKFAAAAATAVICLSGCAAGSRNLHFPAAEQPRPSVREVLKRGVTEEGNRYVATGCSSIRNTIQAKTAGETRARSALARKLAGSNLAHETLRGTEIRDVFTTAEGHTCVVVGMPKPKTSK
ncbi:MAG: hypothetical protein V1722_00635 [Candidatus Micrarchaeota archaeon]